MHIVSKIIPIFIHYFLELWINGYYIYIRFQQITKNMRIPDEVFKKWQDLRSFGDGKKISEQKNITEVDISRAFTTQECSDETFEKLAEFFKEKEERIQKIIQ